MKTMDFFYNSDKLSYWKIEIEKNCLCDSDLYSKIIFYYMNLYQRHFDKVHPYIGDNGLKIIIDMLRERQEEYSLELAEFYILIQQHFNSKYSNCDYSIFHFLNETIFLNRLYETLY